MQVTIKGMPRTCTTWLHETLKENFGFQSSEINDSDKHDIHSRVSGNLLICQKNPVAWLASIKKFDMEHEPESWVGGERGWSVRAWCDQWNRFYLSCAPSVLRGQCVIARHEDALFAPGKLFAKLESHLELSSIGKPIESEVPWQPSEAFVSREELINRYLNCEYLELLDSSEIAHAIEWIDWDAAKIYGYDPTTTHANWYAENLWEKLNAFA